MAKMTKTFTVAKKNGQMSTEKSYLALDCKYVSWNSPVSGL